MAGANGRRATSGDVAREAGVSRATVSYVLNDNPNQKIPRRRAVGCGPRPSARHHRRLRRAPCGRDARTSCSACCLTGRSSTSWTTHPQCQCLRRTRAHLHRALLGSAEPAPAGDLEERDARGGAGTARLSRVRGRRDAGGRPEVVMAVHGSAQAEPGLPWCPRNRSAQHRPAIWPPRTFGSATLPRPGGTRCAGQPRLEGVREVCTELGLPEPDVRIIPLGPEGARRGGRHGWPPSHGDGICAFNDDVALAVWSPCSPRAARPARPRRARRRRHPRRGNRQPPLTTVVRDIDAIARGLARRVVDALDRKQTPADPSRTRFESMSGIGLTCASAGAAATRMGACRRGRESSAKREKAGRREGGPATVPLTFHGHTSGPPRSPACTTRRILPLVRGHSPCPGHRTCHECRSRPGAFAAACRRTAPKPASALSALTAAVYERAAARRVDTHCTVSRRRRVPRTEHACVDDRSGPGSLASLGTRFELTEERGSAPADVDRGGGPHRVRRPHPHDQWGQTRQHRLYKLVDIYH
ncbi:LacI family DNA-binding transcriptional regulator [Streptomyces stelliscabiei]|uniref:LacI family DNA-binding transcriptional regulator n=1 Tax=Streptomyces stelliscabiei TaxID=146820 RepID=UPI002FEFBB3A